MGKILRSLAAFMLLSVLFYLPVRAEELFTVPEGVETRWSSFENPAAAKGVGGQTNQTRKGSASKDIAPGETATLLDIQGPGVIRRIWMTVRGKPENLRGLVLRMYWEDQDYPSVEAPLQDFFGIPFARQTAFESVFFSNPEGRSFNCFIPMPFNKRARVEIENQTPESTTPLFYDIDLTVGDKLPEDLCCFHARYRRENTTVSKKDFQILPRIEGRGRFLGCNVGVRAIGQYAKSAWFGEGEMKIYIDGDREYPTLVGTGTEDLVGSAWGLGGFNHLYQGCLLAGIDNGIWGFYRYHAPDPVYFHREIRVDLQQMQGAMASQINKDISPENYPELVKTHKRFEPSSGEDTWENFEAPQDVCATAYWYQSLPSPKWGPIEGYEARMKDLGLPAGK
jgi:hypothetical protein